MNTFITYLHSLSALSPYTSQHCVCLPCLSLPLSPSLPPLLPPPSPRVALRWPGPLRQGLFPPRSGLREREHFVHFLCRRVQKTLALLNRPRLPQTSIIRLDLFILLCLLRQRQSGPLTLNEPLSGCADRRCPYNSVCSLPLWKLWIC